MITQEMVRAYFFDAPVQRAATKEEIIADMKAAMEYRPKVDPEYVARQIEWLVERECGATS